MRCGGRTAAAGTAPPQTLRPGSARGSGELSRAQAAPGGHSPAPSGPQRPPAANGDGRGSWRREGLLGPGPSAPPLRGRMLRLSRRRTAGAVALPSAGTLGTFLRSGGGNPSVFPGRGFPACGCGAGEQPGRGAAGGAAARARGPGSGRAAGPSMPAPRSQGTGRTGSAAGPGSPQTPRFHPCSLTPA